MIPILAGIAGYIIYKSLSSGDDKNKGLKKPKTENISYKNDKFTI